METNVEVVAAGVVVVVSLMVWMLAMAAVLVGVGSVRVRFPLAGLVTATFVCVMSVFGLFGSYGGLGHVIAGQYAPLRVGFWIGLLLACVFVGAFIQLIKWSNPDGVQVGCECENQEGGNDAGKR